MSYNAFDPTKPDGDDGGTLVPVNANKNDVALWLMIVQSGSAPGFVMSQTVGTGTVAQPQYWLWTNGTRIVRSTNTWGTTGGAANNLSGQLWEVSTDSGSTWATICTEAMSYDSDGEIISTTGAGGFMNVIKALIGKVVRNYAYIVAHVAATGASVHGLASMSTQAANAVAITGGTVSCTIEREAKLALGSINASTPVNWAAAGLYTVTVTGSSATFTHTSLPSGVVGYVTLDITNGGLATSLLTGCKIAGGVLPMLTSAGRDIVALMCHDGSLVTIVGVLLDVK